MTDRAVSPASLFGSADASTFLGLPACGDIAAVKAEIAILGAPTATPYPTTGAYCAEAPGAIRAAMAGYAGTVTHHDFDLNGPLLGEHNARAVDCGDLAFDAHDHAGNRDRIRESMRTLLAQSAVPIVLGGDDSVPIPVLEAYAGRGRFTVLQIDAHLDWRDEVGGERLGLSSTMRRASEMSHIAKIIQVGQRSVGSARKQDVADALAAGVQIVPAYAVHERGVGPVLELIPKGSKVIICFDCDALDPSIMPAVIAPAPGGLSFWHAIGLLHGVSMRARIAGFNLVEFVPARDIGGAGALLAGRIVTNIIGVLARNARTRTA